MSSHLSRPDDFIQHHERSEGAVEDKGKEQGNRGSASEAVTFHPEQAIKREEQQQRRTRVDVGGEHSPGKEDHIQQVAAPSLVDSNSQSLPTPSEEFKDSTFGAVRLDTHDTEVPTGSSQTRPTLRTTPIDSSPPPAHPTPPPPHPTTAFTDEAEDKERSSERNRRPSRIAGRLISQTLAGRSSDDLRSLPSPPPNFPISDLKRGKPDIEASDPNGREGYREEPESGGSALEIDESGSPEEEQAPNQPQTQTLTQTPTPPATPPLNQTHTTTRSNSQIPFDGRPTFSRRPTGHARERRPSQSTPPPSQSTPLPTVKSTSPQRGQKPFYSSPPPAEPRAVQQNLQQTVQDLRNLLKGLARLLPFISVEKQGTLLKGFKAVLAPFMRPVLNHAAKMLQSRGMLASNLAYDLLVVVFKLLINLFFREIRPRGAYKIPHDGDGPVIFVAAPHHNQFLDPLLLLSEVRYASGRRISFLVAEKSMKRKFIGTSASLMQSISVKRSADEAKAGKGRIYLSSPDSPDYDPLIVHGVNTDFKNSLAPQKQLMLPKSTGYATAEVVEVISNVKVKIKKEFGTKGREALLQASPQEGGEVGLDYKILPYIDQSKMYGQVYKKLRDGGNVGIFPEGGSHDRTDLLPLKAGVSIMALGAMSENKDLTVRIVPVGLSYFHPHRFRSRAVVEFGTPISIPKELVGLFEKGGKDKRDAVGKVMDLVVDGLKSVTVRAPDYETLMLIQASRRLYKPPGQHLSLSQVVELNRRFIAGYLKYKDEPKVMELKKRVLEYNKLLRYMGLRDHQVERSRPAWKSLLLLLARVGLLSVWGTLALPGVVLNAPMFIAASIISRKKAKEALAASTVKLEGRDVLATWKILVSLGMAPVLYLFYAGFATYLAYRYNLPRKYKLWMPIWTLAALPGVAYSALKFGEVGMDIYKSLRPLFVSLIPGNQKYVEKLRALRASLASDLSDLVEEFGPQLFDDFDTHRVVPVSQYDHNDESPDRSGASTPITPRRKSTYGPDAQGPMSWLDDALFGWSSSGVLGFGASSRRRRRSSAADGTDSPDGDRSPGAISRSNSGYNTQDDGDYEEAIRVLNDQIGGSENPLAERRRRSSSSVGRRSRIQSQLNLTELDEKVNAADMGTSSAVADGKGGDGAELRQR